MEVCAVKGYSDLIVWRKAVELVLTVYKLIPTLPKSEEYSLVSQIKRAVVSVPSNIAEGYGRGTKEYIHFLRVARGSLFELETQLIIIDKLFGISNEKIYVNCKEVEKILNVMIKKLEDKMYKR
jgi:four helix bundle protein